jgi:hypothetical protein
LSVLNPRYADALLGLAAALPIAFWLSSAPKPAAIALGVTFVAAVEVPRASYVTDLVQLSGEVVADQYAGVSDLQKVQCS